jgi:RNA polymerase sigma-70 factor (ECF subfamily)
LHRLLANACIDVLRRDRRHRLDVAITDTSPVPVVTDPAAAIADRDELERGFRRLDPEERAVIVMHHYLDLPLPEVAATLRIPLGTAKSRLYRGLGQMRAALDADARLGSDVRERRPV